MRASRAKALCAVIGVVAAGIFVNLGYNGLSFIEPMGEGTTLLDSSTSSPTR
ncbi:MAG: hypothetical protein ACLTMP_13050 [Eggerthella lenta]